MEDKTRLVLKNVEIVFANLVDEGFGRSLTINATDESVQTLISEWVKVNNIGKGEKAGKANFKEYEGKKQYALKISDYTKFAGVGDLTKNDLGYGATVSLVAQAFDYDNKFGKGTSSNLSAVVIESRPRTSADDDLTELLGDREVNEPKDPEPKDLGNIPDSVVTNFDDTKEVSLSDIPF